MRTKQLRFFAFPKETLSTTEALTCDPLGAVDNKKNRTPIAIWVRKKGRIAPAFNEIRLAETN